MSNVLIKFQVSFIYHHKASIFVLLLCENSEVFKCVNRAENLISEAEDAFFQSSITETIQLVVAKGPFHFIELYSFLLTFLYSL